MGRLFLSNILIYCSLALLAQKPEMRADPDAWLRTPEVQQARSVLGSTDGLYAVQVNVGQSRLVTVPGSEGAWMLRQGDLRLLVDSAGVNHSKSHNLGFNIGAVPFYWNGKVYLAGGGGFWHYHDKVVEFVANTGEWEWLPCPSGPEHFSEQFGWWDEHNERVVALGSRKTATGSIETTGLFYALNMKGFSWELLGQYNPVFELILKDDGSRFVDLGDYFLLTSIHNALLIRKSDLNAVISSAFNRALLKTQIKAPIEEGVKCLRRGAGQFRIEHHGQADSVVVMLEWDVDSVFNALAGEAMPLVVPVEERLLQDAAYLDAEGGGEPWKFVGVLIALAVAFGLGRRLSSAQSTVSEARQESSRVGQAQVNESVGVSPMVLRFHSLGPITMDTEEVNALLHLGDDLTGETRRARRAQAIRQVNQEYTMRYGVELIRRERHEADRRRTIYVIQPYSGNA